MELTDYTERRILDIVELLRDDQISSATTLSIILDFINEQENDKEKKINTPHGGT